VAQGEGPEFKPQYHKKKKCGCTRERGSQCAAMGMASLGRQEPRAPPGHTWHWSWDSPHEASPDRGTQSLGCADSGCRRCRWYCQGSQLALSPCLSMALLPPHLCAELLSPVRWLLSLLPFSEVEPSLRGPVTCLGSHTWGWQSWDLRPGLLDCSHDCL
jgi:hypothetical protein